MVKRKPRSVLGTVANLAEQGTQALLKRQIKKAGKKAASYVQKKLKFKRKTSAKKKTVLTEDRSLHNDLTIRKLPNVIIPGLHHKGKKTNTMKYTENFQKIVRGTQGFLAFDGFETIGNRNKLYGSTNSTRNDVDQSMIDPWVLDTNRLHLALASNTQLAESKTRRMVYSHVNATYEFVNLQNIPLKCELFLFTPAVDCEETPYQVFQRMCDELAMNYPTAASSATTLGGNAIPGYLNPNIAGVHPLKMKGFKKIWRPLISKVFVLQPGDQISYQHKIIIDRSFSRTMLDSRQSQYLKGFTVYPWVLCRGGLAGLAENTTDNAVQVGYAGVNYGGVISYTHVFRGVPENQLNTYLMTQELTTNAEAVRIKIIDDNDNVADMEEA
nr:MAG: hypothetical protein [Cressdnaviricota sp.]